MKLPDYLYGFQADDTALLLEAPRRLLLEPMGAGKSVMCVAAAEALDAFTIVIVCPAVLRTDWQDKFRKFGRNPYSYRMEDAGRRVITVSYDSVNSPERRERLLQHVKSIDVLILDEAQRLKNPSAQVAGSVYGNDCDGTGLVALAKRVWIVSGTLCPNHWGELYSHLRACFPERLPQVGGKPLTHIDFLNHFCRWENTKYGVKVTGNKEPEVLRALVKGISVYRDRAEIDRLLPKLTVSTVRLPREAVEQAALAALNEMVEFDVLRQAVMELESNVALPNIDDLNLARARHALADLKAPAVADYVRELLADPDNRVLVFGHHRSAMRRIATELMDIEPNVKVIDGHTASRDRDFIVRDFQNKHARVLVLGIGTAREGLTLTAANRVVMAEASWTPTHNDQAIHRAYRIGQTRPVLAEYVCIADSIDEAVMRVCARKSGLLSEVL